MDVALGASNKGHAMLSKMGWKGGGLGRGGEGRDEPVLVEQRAERAGLGAASAHAPAPHTGLEKKRSELWMKTQKRFASTALLEDPNKADEDDQLMPPPAFPPASS